MQLIAECRMADLLAGSDGGVHIEEMSRNTGIEVGKLGKATSPPPRGPTCPAEDHHVSRIC